MERHDDEAMTEKKPARLTSDPNTDLYLIDLSPLDKNPSALQLGKSPLTDKADRMKDERENRSQKKEEAKV